MTGVLVGVQGNDDGADGDGEREAAPMTTGDTAPAPATGGAEIIGQSELKPPPGQPGRFRGTVVAAMSEGRPQIVVSARLRPTGRKRAYEVWLYNSRDDAKSLGAQHAGSNGRFEGAAPLPDDFAEYRHIDISHERVDNDLRHSGRSVLRGSTEGLAP